MANRDHLTWAAFQAMTRDLALGIDDGLIETDAVACPFCGADEPWEELSVTNARDESWAKCSNCGATGPRAIEGSCSHYAVVAWNHRVGPDGTVRLQKRCDATTAGDKDFVIDVVLTSSDHPKPGRESRLMDVIRHIHEIRRETLRNLSGLCDWKGGLAVAWRSDPTAAEKAMIVMAWEDVGQEPGDNVCHLTLPGASRSQIGQAMREA